MAEASYHRPRGGGETYAQWANCELLLTSENGAQDDGPDGRAVSAYGTETTSPKIGDKRIAVASGGTECDSLVLGATTQWPAITVAMLVASEYADPNGEYLFGIGDAKVPVGINARRTYSAGNYSRIEVNAVVDDGASGETLQIVYDLGVDELLDDDHIAVTYDSATGVLALYVNGSAVATDTASAAGYPLGVSADIKTVIKAAWYSTYIPASFKYNHASMDDAVVCSIAAPPTQIAHWSALAQAGTTLVEGNFTP